MRGKAAKAELSCHVGEIGFHASPVFAARMPMQHGVTVVERTGPDHVDFSAASFFCRAAVKPNGTGNAFLRQPLLYGNRRRHRSGPKEIMSTAVARLGAARRPLDRHAFLS